MKLAFAASPLIQTQQWVRTSNTPTITPLIRFIDQSDCTFTLVCLILFHIWNKSNNKITELRTILQRESQNS
jgi:hypothetical protein